MLQPSVIFEAPHCDAETGGCYRPQAASRPLVEFQALLIAQSECSAHGNDGGDDCMVVPFFQHGTHERLVDFQLVCRQALEVGQGGISCPEIIDGDGESGCAQLRHQFGRLRDVLHHPAFGQFQLEAGRR